MPNKNEAVKSEEVKNEPKPLGDMQDWAVEQQKRFISVYGSTVKHSILNVQKEALEAIKITAPEDVADIGEEFITMVTMGASMNPDYVAHLKTTSSTGGSDTPSFNQGNFISNITGGDDRFLTKGFSDALLHGRIDAAEAIEQYKQGNYEPVKKALRCFLQVAGMNAREIQTNLANEKDLSVEFGASALVDKLLSAKLPFSMEEVLPGAELAKLKSGVYLNKVYFDTSERVRAFRQNPGAPGSPERDAMLSRIALGLYMAQFYPVKATQCLVVDGPAFGAQELQTLGIEPGTVAYEELSDGQFGVDRMMGMKMRDIMLNRELTDLEYIYSLPGAAQWVETNFLKQIKETPAYQAALAETDPAKLAGRLNAIASESNRNNGIEGYVKQEHFAQTTQARAQLSGELQETHNAGLEDMREFIRGAISEYREVEAVRDLLRRSAAALEDVPEAAALCQAALTLNGTIDTLNRPVMLREEAQEGLREVSRLVAAYTRAVREKTKGEKGEDWEPRNEEEKAAYRAAKQLEAGLAPHIVLRPEEVKKPAHTVDRNIGGMRADERREIERSMDLFDAIPETNTDKAIDELLRREERYRADHPFEQGLLMASGVRTVMLLAAQKRFAPGEHETAAETARRHRAMKEALSPDRVLNNMLAIYVNMSGGAITPIEGVTLKDGYDAIQGAFIGYEDGSAATTEDVRERLEMNIAYVEPFDNTGEEKLSFYEGSEAFEQSFLNDGEPLPQQHAEEYGKVQKAFRSLNDTLAPFYERDENGALPTLTEEDFASIRDGYQNTFAEINAYMTRMSQAGRPLDVRRTKQLESFQDGMVRDLVALEAGRQLGLSTLPNIMLSGNMPTAEIAGTPEIYGGAANARMRVSLPGNDGIPVEGFFTATNVLPDWGGVFDKTLDKHTEGHPEWRELIEKTLWKDKNNLQRLSENLNYESGLHNSVDQSGLLDARFEGAEPQLAELYRRCRSHEFSMTFLNFTRDYIRQMSALEQFKGQGLTEGNLDKRNSAMSTMADMMNLSGVVAPARSVVVRIGGKEMAGTFMEFADGEDLSRVQKGGPLDIIRVEDMLTPESVSSVADLQVLDYVCGNVDRHSKNMFYKLDTTDPLHPKCIGVQGIDNDFSFCARANGKSMADILNMKIIRRETAEALFSMKPEMIKNVLGKYDLSQREIFGVLKRIGELKKAAEDGKLKIVTDEQIKTMNYQTELLSGGENYFKRLVNVPRAAHSLAFESDGAAMDKAYRGLNANTPALGKCYDSLVAANRGKFIGSKEYRDVMRGLEDLVATRAELLGERDPERIALYERKLSALRRNVTRYLIKKAAEARRSKPSKLAQRRVAVMKAFSAKLRVEEEHIQDYREAQASRERNLNGRTREQEFSARQNRDNLEVDRYLAKGAARELFPRLANRQDPLLAQCGATLKEDADVVFAKVGEPDTPEMLARKESLYAGLIANRMIEQRLEKQGETARKLLDAWKTNPNLFEQMRERVRSSPVFNKEDAHAIDRNLTNDTAKFDNMIKRIEQAAQPKAEEPEKQPEQPQQKVQQNDDESKKKAPGPKIP